MVLSGTLREFILADVFQLLTQQKTTGKLHLNNNVDEGVIVFRSGAIVSAIKNSECLESKLENYLIEIKNVNTFKIKAIFTTFKDDLQGLTNEIITQSLVTSEELSSLSESIIEDITCSMFLWNSGSYKFNSMRNVDKFIPINTVIPIENIVMEAMRRVDEWNRMQELFNNETVFAPASKSNASNESLCDPIADPVNYMYCKINGMSPVKQLISETPLTQYKVYESLYALIQSQQIVPLSNKIIQSVHAALEKRDIDDKRNSVSTFFSILVVTGLILVVILISSWFFRGILFSQTTINSYISRSELPQAIAVENKNIADIYLKSLGKEGTTEHLDSLLQLKLISKKDLKFLKIKAKATE